MANQTSKFTYTKRINPNSIHCDRSNTDAQWLTSEVKKAKKKAQWTKWTNAKLINPELNYD